MRKIQLAIWEGRYSIWTRNPPNFPDEYLKPVLRLPDRTPVKQKRPRRSGGSGLNYVVELKYTYNEMGRPIQVYLKGYFEQQSEDERLIISLAIQSLKDDSEDNI